jgi:hypothetical protein
MPMSAQEAESSDQYLLEAHYYEDGLRSVPLATGGERPSWAPAQNSVGFQDEFKLFKDDAAVEFCRWAVGGVNVTWIGVYVRSVDGLYGDRGNHAGVGLWLRGRRVVRPVDLLDALFEFARGIAAEPKLDNAERGAAELRERFLGKFTIDSDEFPDDLAGWQYRPPLQSDTAYFLAAAPDSPQRWALAGEQLIRMSFLPPDASETSRALILVPGDGGAQRSYPRGEPKAIAPHVVEAVLARIPSLVTGTVALNRKLEDQLASANSQAGELSARVEALTREKKELESQAAALSGQIRKSDTLTALQAVLKGLGEIKGQERATVDRLSSIETRLQQALANRPPPAPPGDSSIPAAIPNPPLKDGNWRRWTRKVLNVVDRIAIGLLIAVVVSALLWILYTVFVQSNAPSTDEIYLPPERDRSINRNPT